LKGSMRLGVLLLKRVRDGNVRGGAPWTKVNRKNKRAV